jgi:hypothetical protein
VSGFQQAADPVWVLVLAREGYVALVWDHLGNGPDGARMPDSIAPATPISAFGAFQAGPSHCNPYQTVAAAVRGVSLLRSLPEVAGDRVGISGLSWGGAMACIVASLDDRLACAVAAYGCGGIGGSGVWAWYLKMLPPDLAREWVRLFDAWNYLPWVKCPVLFLTGTNDEYFSLGIHRESFLALRQPRWLSVRVEMPHGPYYRWSWWGDAQQFFARWLKGGAALPEIHQTGFGSSIVQAQVRQVPPEARASLVWTRDTGAHVSRKWHSTPAPRVGDLVSAWVPTEATAYYLAIEDIERRVLVSTPVQAAGVVPPGALAMNRRPTDYGRELTLLGEPGREYALQFSDDLRVWRPVSLFNLADRTAVIREDERWGQGARGFYRVVVVP